MVRKYNSARTSSRRPGGKPQGTPALHVSQDRALPLSFAQERLWFLERLHPANPAHNVFAVLRFTGRLNLAGLERGLDEIVRRHEVLRTIFFTTESQHPGQRIASTLNVPLRLVNLSGSPKSEREVEAQRLAMEENRRPFELTQEPLLRTTLVRLGKEEHMLVLTMHRMISDQWSLGVFVRELTALYKAFSTGKPSPLPKLPLQYADYVEWQRRWLTGEVSKQQLAYWKQQLSNASDMLELPTDRLRPSVQTFRGARKPVILLKSLSEALKELSRREGVTLFVTLLAAFQTLLARYTSQDDIIVGSPVAGRTRARTKELIGLFENTLVLRTDLSNDPSFRELLRRVRETVLAAYTHQDLPFEKLVEELQLRRDLSRNPLFQVMFALENTSKSALKLQELTVRHQETIDPKTTRFDLRLELADTPEGLRGSFEYNTDLFEAATIGRMAGHLQVLLEGILAGPEKRLSELPLLAAAERHQLLIEWNDTETDYPRGKTIHQLFEEQVERTPDAVAVMYEQQQVTYRELNQRANQMAHHLRRLGVEPKARVGIMMDRSPKMVAGLLGILKAGGAYVPLDPAYPKERLSFIFEDAEVSVLLTQQHLAEKLPEHTAHVVELDQDETIVGDSKENLLGGVGAENLAYLMYTSGSTGRPKGIAIEHRSTVALSYWAREFYAPEDLAGVLASTSINFDLSVFELFVPLSWGGKVILLGGGTMPLAENALRLPTLPSAEDVTLINTVPSAMAELVRVDGVPTSVRIVNLCGEPLQNVLAQRIYQRETIQQVFNLYGPTEDTVYSTVALVKRGASKPPAIGHPLPNTRIYLLDEHLQPVPVGAGGELHIGGAGLARGYLNRPQLTAERFITDPFSDEPGARLYKTGDLVRYRTDGTLEFLGRLDHQVKIQGYRIELGEIETALVEHPGVDKSVVMVREEESSGKRLVAYVVANAQPAPSASELHGFLKDKLPEYMLPSTFVLLEALPLTLNGKVDRKALPEPDYTRSELEGAYAAPRTSQEETLARIWAGVLGLERVSIRDDFFKLGGDSLLAAQAISRICDAFEVELPLRTLFERTTIAGLAVPVAEAVLMAEIEKLSNDEVQEIPSEET